MKFCRKCNQMKSVEEFSSDAHQYDGKTCYCKSCMSEIYIKRQEMKKQGRIPTLARFTNEELLFELNFRLNNNINI